MSLATFKKKTIHSVSSATKRSGKPTHEYWLYPGPYGRNGNLPSTLFNASLDGFGVHPASNAGFSVTGSYRNKPTNTSMVFSKSATPFRGQYPKGWGGTRGRYPDGPNEVSLNIMPVLTGVAVQNTVVKPPVLSTRGMLERRYRWIHNGQYPSHWVQPVYTGNQTLTSSQGMYLQKKSASNDCHLDVNNEAKYVDHIVRCGPMDCHRTPARGYKMNVQQAIAPYSKSIHQPKDSSDYTLRIQRQCQNPIGPQKPFPYAVQTGTGVLRGGIQVSHVASACNTSPVFVTPPAWWWWQQHR